MSVLSKPPPTPNADARLTNQQLHNTDYKKWQERWDSVGPECDVCYRTFNVKDNSLPIVTPDGPMNNIDNPDFCTHWLCYKCWGNIADGDRRCPMCRDDVSDWLEEEGYIEDEEEREQREIYEQELEEWRAEYEEEGRRQSLEVGEEEEEERMMLLEEEDILHNDLWRRAEREEEINLMLDEEGRAQLDVGEEVE